MQTRSEARAQPFTRYDETGLQELLNAYDARMKRLNDQYLRMMGEHIAEIGTMIPSDVHRLQQIRRMNKNLSAIERRIAAAAGMSVKDIRQIFEQAAQEDVRMAQKILGVPDTVRVSDNLPLQRILQAQVRETAGKLENLSNTTVVSKPYRNAVDEAVSAVQSGVEDYGSAIRRTIREAGQMGLRVRGDGTTAVDYESGYSRRLDSAVRMNILDGVRHLNQSIMEEVGREFGADGIEIDAHMLCAEDHLPYQGRQFSNADFEEIQSSLPRPFGEWNCRHSWHPILLGISEPTYTPDQLQEMRDYSTEEIEIDGRTKTRYEWSQEMRRAEVAIRQTKDVATLADAAGDDTLRRQCQGKIVAMNEHYRTLAGKAGMKPEFSRTYVAGFRDAKDKSAMSNGNKKSNWPENGKRINKIELEELQAYAEERKIKLRGFETFDGDVSLIREFIDGMDRVARDFPEVYTAFKTGLQIVNDKNMHWEDYADAGHHSSIRINQAAFRSRTELKHDYEIRVEEGRFVKGTTYRCIAYHEMGHVVLNALRLSQHELVDGVDREKISEYAVLSRGEGIAETFSAIYGGVDTIKEVLTIWERCSRMVEERRKRT